MLKLSPLLLAMVTLPAAAGPWVCDEKTDRMDGSVSRAWIVDSTNREAVMPWSTPATGRLVVYVNRVQTIIPDDGVVNCSMRAPCPARIAIDGHLVDDAQFRSLTDWSVSAHIDPQLLAQAHQVKVEVPVFQSRPAVYVFDLPGQAPVNCPLQ